MRRLYLDLDGVMADFDAHFPALFGVDHRDMLDEEMWATINAHPSYFLDMPLCPGARDFFSAVRPFEPIVLTACPKSNYAHVAHQKREWVRRHLSPDITVLPVMGGRNKALFMHAPGDVLVDDLDRNCDVWEAAGGIAVRHRDFSETTHRIGVLF